MSRTRGFLAKVRPRSGRLTARALKRVVEEYLDQFVRMSTATSAIAPST
jgi:hypothetical protein